jgi:glycosyltransferase involved in cell wall biosynthesis
VSDDERALFAGAGVPNVFRVSHAIVPQATPDRSARRSILFVGAFSPDSPNEDAISYLCTDILPALQRTSVRHAPVIVAGSRIPDRLRSAGTPAVSWHSNVDDLSAFYAAARVFVAPTRYAAGIPLKLLEAASFGVPIVCTPLLARQLGWSPGVELLVAESPEQFARDIESLFVDDDKWQGVQERALARVSKDYSPLAGSGVL